MNVYLKVHELKLTFQDAASNQLNNASFLTTQLHNSSRLEIFVSLWGREYNSDRFNRVHSLISFILREA